MNVKNSIGENVDNKSDPGESGDLKGTLRDRAIGVARPLAVNHNIYEIKSPRTFVLNTPSNANLDIIKHLASIDKCPGELHLYGHHAKNGKRAKMLALVGDGLLSS